MKKIYKKIITLVKKLTLPERKRHIGMLRGLLREEIDVEKVDAFLKSERKKWRL